MAATVSDFMFERMHEGGTRTIYGYSGDGINGLMGALGRAEDEICVIRARHEEEAALMACGHPKFTGEVGVCMATSGPGAVHLLNGLYDAAKDISPRLSAMSPDSGCCGMAGSFRFEKDHYDVSMAVAERALLPAVRGASLDSLIVTDGFSCREQVKGGSSRQPLHLAEVIQRALSASPGAQS